MCTLNPADPEHPGHAHHLHCRLDVFKLDLCVCYEEQCTLFVSGIESPLDLPVDKQTGQGLWLIQA